MTDKTTELLAKDIYRSMEWACANNTGDLAPKWVEGGNSHAQTEARSRAADILARPALPDEAALVDTVSNITNMFDNPRGMPCAREIITALRPYLSNGEDKARIAELEAAIRNIRPSQSLFKGIVNSIAAAQDLLPESDDNPVHAALSGGE